MKISLREIGLSRDGDFATIVYDVVTESGMVVAPQVKATTTMPPELVQEANHVISRVEAALLEMLGLEQSDNIADSLEGSNTSKEKRGLLDFIDLESDQEL